MTSPTKLELAAQRLRRARNLFLVSQVAVLDLSKLSSSEAARLDFPESRAKRLAESVGRPNLGIDEAMNLYSAVERLIDNASARRDEARAERETSDQTSAGESEAQEADQSSLDTVEAAEGESAESTTASDDDPPADAVAASDDVSDALKVADLPEYASFRAIKFVVKVRAEKSRSDLMLESLLLSSVAQFEVFISRVIRTSLSVDPSPLKASEKTFTFNDVSGHESIGAFRAAAANSYVDSLMYKGMDSWMKFLTKATRTDMEWVTDLLAEVIMRRNVHVHAGGVASPQYLSELGKRAAAVKLGDDLPVTSEYLEDALNRMARAAIVLSQAGIAAICNSATSDMTAKHSIDRDMGVVEASFDLLVNGRFSALEELAAQLDPLVATNSTRERLRANSLTARKQLYGSESIASDLLAWDVSAAEDELVLAKHCLLDDVAKAQILYEELVAAKKMSVMELATWPVLEPLRVAMEAAEKSEGSERSQENDQESVPEDEQDEI